LLLESSVTRYVFIYTFFSFKLKKVVYLIKKKTRNLKFEKYTKEIKNVNNSYLNQRSNDLEIILSLNHVENKWFF